MSGTKVIAWSHSRISKFKECPKRFHEEDILKSVPFVETEAMRMGNVVHKMLESRVAKGTPLPQGYEKYESLCQAIISMPGQVFTELQLALNEKLQPTGWFSSDTYVRIIIDVMKLTPTMAWVADYKTGKMTLDEHQLKLFAAVLFQTYPELQVVHTSYLWLRDAVPDSKTYTKSQLLDLWGELLVDPARLQACAEASHWPARPSRRCSYCLVNKHKKCAEAGAPYRGD